MDKGQFLLVAFTFGIHDLLDFRMAFVEEILPELWKIRQFPLNQGPTLNHALTNGGKEPIAIILHHCSGKGREIIAGTCDHQVAPDQQDVVEFGLP